MAHPAALRAFLRRNFAAPSESIGCSCIRLPPDVRPLGGSLAHVNSQSQPQMQPKPYFTNDPSIRLDNC